MGSSCSVNRRNEEEWCRPRIAQSITGKNKKRKKKKMDEERRKHLLQALSAEAQTSEILSRIPGRIYNNGSTSSACAYTQQGKKGTNQDAMLVWEHFASRQDTLLCCVFDGHGPYGHLVARKVRDTLPTKLMGLWKARMRGDINIIEDEEDGDDESDEEGDSNEKPDENSGYAKRQGRQNFEDVNHNSRQSEQQRCSWAMRVWRESFMRGFRSMDRDLRMQPTIDCFCSGTTAIILLQQGMELMMGNVGDSRAVLATYMHSGHSNTRGRRKTGIKEPTSKLQAIQLTLDLKPNLPREAERIRRCKGRVFAMEDEPDVARVWLPYDNAPGLAMARAFGDFCLKDYGLISVPDITYRTLTPNDQFVILATDGIWDVMSNSQAVEVVACAPSRVTAARLLVETAVRAWRLKYPTSKVDDCAVICLFFHQEASTTMRCHSPAATSTYYYSEGDDEDHDGDDEKEDEDIIPAKDTPKLAPSSPPSHSRKSREMQSSQLSYITDPSAIHGVEPEEIMWDVLSGGAHTSHHRIDVESSPNNTPYPGYFVDTDEASPPSVLEIQMIDLPGSSSLQRKGKEQTAMSPPRRSLAEYMSSNGDGGQEDDDEWSALEGVVRVNSILNLPRFKEGDDPSMRRA
ncbi:hypothetical protein GOP47_0001981 [Adiantum capillus-veneris]|uniref:PPM-type phosphatase domain-containing protein n=1 Tax=Adiantum capillus-veneris TaxID=13818 RepID=A0A9D4ZNL6_ADICA|nr:hypothetical protein GOP47_0001981 [Adiantum capillus-veneris]